MTDIKIGDYVEIKKDKNLLHLIGRFGSGSREVIKTEIVDLSYEKLFVTVKIDEEEATYYSSALIKSKQ